jgi:hypothetical protein
MLIKELKNERPAEPVFIKPDSAILLKQHPFCIPDFSEDIHHEIELIVKINKVGKYIEPKFAHKYYDELVYRFYGLAIYKLPKSERSCGKSKSI